MSPSSPKWCRFYGAALHVTNTQIRLAREVFITDLALDTEPTKLLFTSQNTYQMLLSKVFTTASCAEDYQQRNYKQ